MLAEETGEVAAAGRPVSKRELRVAAEQEAQSWLGIRVRTNVASCWEGIVPWSVGKYQEWTGPELRPPKLQALPWRSVSPFVALLVGTTF